MKNVLVICLVISYLIGLSIHYLNEYKEFKIDLDTKYPVLEYVDDDLIAVR